MTERADGTIVLRPGQARPGRARQERRRRRKRETARPTPSSRKRRIRHTHTQYTHYIALHHTTASLTCTWGGEGYWEGGVGGCCTDVRRSLSVHVRIHACVSEIDWFVGSWMACVSWKGLSGCVGHYTSDHC